MSRFTDTLSAQVANEFGASQQYVAIAVWYDAETLPQLAAFFYRQAVEERNHAMMLVQYLLNSGEAVAIPGSPPRSPPSPTRRARLPSPSPRSAGHRADLGPRGTIARDEHDRDRPSSSCSGSSRSSSRRCRP